MKAAGLYRPRKLRKNQTRKIIRQAKAVRDTLGADEVERMSLEQFAKPRKELSRNETKRLIAMVNARVSELLSQTETARQSGLAEQRQLRSTAS